jgi:hypothetical protein
MPNVANLIAAARQLTEADRRQLLKELQPRRHGERKPERNHFIVSEHQRGLTPGQIAKKIGMTRGAVRQVLRRRRKLMGTTVDVPIDGSTIGGENESGGLKP